MVPVPAGTRVRVIALAVVAALAACGDGAGESVVTPVAETCIDLGATEAVGLAWSQTGRYLGIGTFDPEGATTARVIDSEGRVVVEPIDDSDMLSATVVVTPDGRPAWVERRDGRDVLVERREDGNVETEVPDDIFGMAWTAVGFALLQLPFPEGGTRILNLDVDRPDAPTVSYETELRAEHVWISADPETKLLSIVDTDRLPPPVSFLLVHPEAERRYEPPDADTTGASMPALRQWVVYHAPATYRMMAISVADPGRTVVLVDRDAARGSISDGGILAYVPVEPYGRLCLADVSAKLR